MRFVALFAALIASPLAAQDLMMGGINNSWSSTQLLLNSEKEAWAAPECVDPDRWSTACPGPRPTRRDAPSDSPAATSAEAALRFTPSPERRKRNMAKFVDKTRATNPAGAAQVEQFLATTDVFAELETGLAPLGLRIDDLGDAMTLYAMEAWEIANNHQFPTTRARTAAVRRQMVQGVAGNPLLATLDDAAKQETAEAMLIQATILSTGYAQAKALGDKKIIAQISDAAHRGAIETLGFDVRSVDMDEAGIHAKPTR
jgi:hypothetical protein